ncbi:hypothetical protein [Sinomonas notoginsengisoli]|uniref:hypothetical protein n=1 Tax=Sinomonas notoginsengisoli TaxID=1457311 RepID=UPI001F23FE4C|nr:hypothetical protein [Sinomonas notoginsengisoli]
MNTMDALYETALASVVTTRPDAYRLFARGSAVRLRRGAYVSTELWVRLDAASRFRLAAAALAWAYPDTVFCGETALFLRGLPVVKTPPTIDVATATTTRLGIRPATFEVCGEVPLAVQARNLAPPPIRRHRHVPLEAEQGGPFRVLPLAVTVAEVLGSAKFARALTIADGAVRLNPSIPPPRQG